MDLDKFNLIRSIIFRYLIKRSKNYAKERECAQRKNDKHYKFEEVKEATRKAILDCKTIEELLDGQFEGKFTCKELVTVYCERAYRIGRQLKITADECFEEALKLADAKDKETKECLNNKRDPHKQLGKLHGIPFSVKDQFKMIGYLSTIGVGSNTDPVTDEEAKLVLILRQEGGIPIVKGNISPICLTIHSENRIWGCAQNPWSNQRTCGGSSGGDAALVASQCSVFGIGSDLGGSLRLPATFNGVMTFLPTPARQTNHGNIGYFELPGNLKPVGISCGPFTRNTDDLIRFMNITFSQKYFDMTQDLPNLPFDTELFKETLNSKKLRIGIIKDLEPAIGACKTGKRALEDVQAIFEKLGHEVIEVEIPSIEEHCDNQLFFIVNEIMPHLTIHWNKHCDDIDDLAVLNTMYNTCTCIPKTITKILELVGQSRLSSILKNVIKPDVDGFAHHVKIRNVHIEQVNKIFTEKNLDAMIVLPAPFPAFQAALAKDVGLAPIGARLAIYWQFPSGTIPVTLVKEDEEIFEEKAFNDGITEKCREAMIGSTGLPVGVEIITTPFKDEKAMAIMKILEEQIKFTNKHPYPKYD